MSETRITIPARLSYARVWDPASINGGPEKYSASLIIPKSDVATVDQIKAAIDAALEKGASKFGGKKPPAGQLKLPLRDGDIDRDDEAYQGAYFINANSITAPQIVDQKVRPILDQSLVYSGCYVNVSVEFYAFNTNGNKGVAAGLGNIQLVRDGERLDGRVSANADFGAIEPEDDFLN